MMKFKNIYLLLFLLPVLSFSIHKYYVSLTQIEYKKDEKTVQIIMNVFVNDIELTMNNDYKIDLQLNTKKELKNSDEYFKKYLTTHFKMKVNNKEVVYHFIGKEYDGNNIVYFYLEIENISDIKTITVQNNVLMNFFSRQQNLIKSKVNGVHKSTLLTKENDTRLLKF